MHEVDHKTGHHISGKRLPQSNIVRPRQVRLNTSQAKSEDTMQMLVIYLWSTECWGHISLLYFARKSAPWSLFLGWAGTAQKFSQGPDNEMNLRSSYRSASSSAIGWNTKLLAKGCFGGWSVRVLKWSTSNSGNLASSFLVRSFKGERLNKWWYCSRTLNFAISLI